MKKRYLVAAIIVAVMAVPPMDRLEKAIAERDAAASGRRTQP